MKIVGLTDREAMELAYGLLWPITVDAYTERGRRIRDARLALGNALGRDGKASGIERARAALSK